MVNDPTQPLDLDQSRNGVAGPASIDTSPKRLGPRMPGRREVYINLIGDYSAFRVKIWQNYPHKLALDVQSQDEDRMASAMSQILLEHNNWGDEDGNPIPQLQPAPMGTREGDPEFADARTAFLDFWDRIPQELGLAITTAVGFEVGKLARSVAERRRS